MMPASSREARKARMAAAAARRAEPEAKPAGRTAIRSKPVRITVDLSPSAHRELSAWTTAAAAELDVPRLPMADAIRAMVKATTLDKGVSAMVTDLIRREHER